MSANATQKNDGWLENEQRIFQLKEGSEMMVWLKHGSVNVLEKHPLSSRDHKYSGRIDSKT